MRQQPQTNEGDKQHVDVEGQRPSMQLTQRERKGKRSIYLWHRDKRFHFGHSIH